MARRSSWTLLTTHGVVVLLLARRPKATVAELARWAEVSERQVARVLRELRDEGIVAAERDGRNTRYWVNTESHGRRAAMAGLTIGEFIAAMLGTGRIRPDGEPA